MDCERNGHRRGRSGRNELKEELLMKRKTIGAMAGLLAVAGLAGPLMAQDGTKPLSTEVKSDTKKHDAKALEVIDTFVEKVGGKDMIMSIESTTVTGTIDIPMAGIKGSMKMYAAKPGKMAMVMELPGFGKTETGYDGEYGWSSDPMQGPRLLTEEEVSDLAEQADPNSAAKHREIYDVISYAGEVQFSGQKAHKISLTRPNGRESTEFYSVESGMLIGQEAVQASPMGEIKITTNLSDYKEFGGMKMPTKMVQNIGPQQIVMTITDATINNVDNTVFERPAAVQALVEATEQP
mgnify:CR=1 FL=1|tara:strand:- start:10053 stop:10934 length:882 start_codon:yes stop_codon:yes gene_type:complete